MWQQWFNCNFTKLRDNFFAQRKQKNDIIQQFFTSASPSGAILESIMMHARAFHCIILVFFEHKKYSRSFIKWWLNHWCHMDYFNDILTTFMCRDCGSAVSLSMEGQRALTFHHKYLNLCSEDEQRSYGFGTTWGWVVTDIILIFGELSL